MHSSIPLGKLTTLPTAILLALAGGSAAAKAGGIALLLGFPPLGDLLALMLLRCLMLLSAIPASMFIV